MSVTRRRLLDIIEAAYVAGISDVRWRQGLCEATTGLDEGAGVAFLEMHRTADGVLAPCSFGTASDRFREWFVGTAQALPPHHADVAFSWRSSGRTASTLLGREWPGYERVLADHGVRDLLPSFGVVDERRVFGLYVPLEAVRVEPRSNRRKLELLGAHLASARRARDHSEDEAWLTPDGRLVDALGEAVAQRERLREVVRQVDRARASARDDDDGFALWPALVEGRWSLLDRFDADGRRFVVARRNPPDLRAHVGLEGTEARVARLVGMGQSSKYVAYTLGLSEATVSRLLDTAMLKLRVRTRADLVRLMRDWSR